MKSVRKGVRVILRVDLNFPFEYKIKRILPTIHQLVRKNATIILLTHLDKEGSSLIVSEGLDTKRNYMHLDLLARTLRSTIHNLYFVKGKISPCPVNFFDHHRNNIILLDNVRLDSGEEHNNLRYARTLASWGDYYINDAFAVSHRNHASIILLPKLLPHDAGPLLRAEMANLSKVFVPRRPFLLVLGGNKYSTKEPLVARFLQSANTIFFTGALANTFLRQRGKEIGRSPADSKKIQKSILWHQKIKLPSDFVVLRNGRRIIVSANDIGKRDIICDIGQQTISEFEENARKAKFILWNGTPGFVERGFLDGTNAIASAIGKSKGFRITGGGDTVSALLKLKQTKNFDFISTGGGAMLEFLAKGTLPGIEAIRRAKS